MQRTRAAFQLPLPVDADLRHDQMAAVALHFLVRQLGQVHVDLRGCSRAAGDRRHDAHDVARHQRRLLALKIPDIVLVHVDVDEVPQPPFRAKQMLAQFAVSSRLASSSPTVLPRSSTTSLRPVSGAAASESGFCWPLEILLFERRTIVAETPAGDRPWHARRDWR